MNYYERHLGDYARDTGHLSMLEHGAYSLLLDRYYITEQGIEADQAHRVARARTREEKAAVDAVLAEFFRLSNGRWIQSRAEGEIVDAQKRIEAARTNGKNGGRPRKQKQTQGKPAGFPLGSENETQIEPNQKLSNLQSPISNLPLPPPGGDAQMAAAQPEDPQGFSEFWSTWPLTDRKQDRKKCAEKWRKSKFSAQVAAIVAHVEASKATKKWRDGYEPAPLTYLNGERWKDGDSVSNPSALWAGAI